MDKNAEKCAGNAEERAGIAAGTRRSFGFNLSPERLSFKLPGHVTPEPEIEEPEENVGGGKTVHQNIPQVRAPAAVAEGDKRGSVEPGA